MAASRRRGSNLDILICSATTPDGRAETVFGIGQKGFRALRFARRSEASEIEICFDWIWNEGASKFKICWKSEDKTRRGRD